MKYPVNRFKSLKRCIKELEPFIRNGEHLKTGKPLKRFGNLRSREILANWLLCVTINFEERFERLNFCSDPLGGDGIIHDNTDKTWPTEHTLVVDKAKQTNELEEIETSILKAIEKKQNKGGIAYASGKTLIVFLWAKGNEWFPNKVARKLPKIDFNSIWIVGLQAVIEEEYIYNVIRLDIHGCPIWQVCITKNFDSWKVKKI